MGKQLRLKGFFGVFFILCLIISIARADIPKTIHFQGILTDTNSKAVNGIFDMECSLWMADQPDGDPVWTEIHDNIILHAGVYSVYLGGKSTPPVYEQVDFSRSYFIGIRIRPQGETTWSDYMKNDEGRFQPLVSVPVAFYAYHASSINDNTISTEKLSDQSVTSKKLADLSVNNRTIADNAVTTDKLSDLSVTEQKLSDSVQGKLSTISNNSQAIAANALQITTIQNNFNASLSTKADRSELDQKANIENVYDRSSIDTQLLQKADKSALLLKADLSLLAMKADNDNVYTRSRLYTQQQVDHFLSQKVDSDDSYNQQVIDSKLSEKASLSDLSLKADKSALALKADKTTLNLKADRDQVYTRGQLLTRTEIEELTKEKVEISNVYDRSTIDHKLSEKADYTQLALKADITMLAQKADQSQLNLKADISALDLKADKDQVYTRDQLFTRNEIEDITNKKADTTSVYDRTTIDNKLSEKVDQSQLELKADNSALDLKADKEQVYTRSQLFTRNEIEDITNKKADTSSIYDRTTIDNKLSEKADQSQLALKADSSALDLKADKDQVYTRSQLFTRSESTFYPK